MVLDRIGVMFGMIARIAVRLGGRISVGRAESTYFNYFDILKIFA
jgi:hypothetical protein